MSLTLDVPASLHEIDLRLHHARAAWHELLEQWVHTDRWPQP